MKTRLCSIVGSRLMLLQVDVVFLLGVTAVLFAMPAAGRADPVKVCPANPGAADAPFQQ